MKHTDIPKLLDKHGSLRGIARATGVSYDSVRRRYVKAVEAGLIQQLPLGRKLRRDEKAPATKQRVKAMKPKRARHRTYILTSAQNNTDLHEGTWENLQALAKHYDATIYVSTFLYAKRRAPLNKRPKPGDRDEIWFDPRIVPFIKNERVEIAKGLVWCGELNISPTAGRPLSRMEVYTGRASMVLPHTRQEMLPIATFDGDTKLNYTTGTCTLRNYIQRKEGFIAEFYHTYGALIVETDDDGHWYVRQLNAESDGTLYDWDLKVQGGKITKGHRLAAINPGDCHVAQMDPEAKEIVWGEDGLVDTLRPAYQFIHDVYDGYARSHHKAKDPYDNILSHFEGRDSVKKEVDDVAAFLKHIKRDYCQTVVVNSNHDRHLDRWLADNDGRKDPINAAYWSWLNAEKVKYMEAMHAKPELLWLAIELARPGSFCDENNVEFLEPGKRFIICKEHGGIECGMHGDKGNNGARGALRGFAMMGRRSNTGHAHGGGILGGAFQAGTMTGMKLDYNKDGPSNWTQTLIFTYENGKRTLVTLYAGKARA